MSTLLYRLGHWSVRRRRVVLGGWVVVLIGMTALSGAVGGSTSDGFAIPGTESQRAMDLLEERFPEQSGSGARIVFASEDGTPLTDRALRSAIEDALAAVADGPEVTGVSDPFTTDSVSPEATIAFAEVQFDTSSSEVEDASVEAFEGSAAIAEQAGIRVELGGEVVEDHGEEEGGSAEMIGLAVAVVVLLLSFGSVVAMGLPLVSAITGVGIGLAGIGVIAGFTDLASSATILATMLGLAVGIDYALFIVTRHRQNLSEGHDVEEAAARANATAGGAVVFAGLTVVIALAGLSVVGIPFLTAMGLSAAGTVLIAVAIAITLLPALLGFAGTNIDRWRIGRARTGSAAESQRTLSARWARGVLRRPGMALAGGLAVMLVLAIPALSLRLGMPDAGTAPASTTHRQAYDLLADGFGPGFNGPLSVVVDTTGLDDPSSAVADVADRVAADPGVLAVGEPVTNPAGDTTIVPVVPRTSPASEATESLVHHLRSDVLAPFEDETGATASLTGQTAVLIDLSDKMTGALPIFMLIVIGLTTLLLLVVFRSIVVPIKAALAILLSIASSFGVLVAVFQWGWLADLVGIEESVPIISFLPMLMFAVLFGLSMDYEVFILSRIREEYVRTDQPRSSVLTGLTSSARVISAAALIMISVFGSFVLEPDPTTKMFGVGFSVAVLLDATVVRMLIVPAVMALFDRKAWWLPSWLDRRLPDLDIEGEHLLEALDAEEAAVEERELVGV